MKRVPFFLLCVCVGAGCLFASRTAAILPEGSGPYLDQKIEFQRDVAQVKYDPVAREAAAERQRQATRDAMAKPPMDVPDYRRAMQEKRGMLTAGIAPGRGAVNAPGRSMGEAEAPSWPLVASRGGGRRLLVLVLGGLAVATGMLYRHRRQS